MTLEDLVRRLQALLEQGHGPKTVKLADWNEGYRTPSAAAAEIITVDDDQIVLGE